MYGTTAAPSIKFCVWLCQTIHTSRRQPEEHPFLTAILFIVVLSNKHNLKLILFVAALGLEPDFLYPLENVTIAQGRDAMFTCVVNNLGATYVIRDNNRNVALSNIPSIHDFIRVLFVAVWNRRGLWEQVAWIKADTKAILAIHEHVITNNARLSVTHNDYNTWTLNIRTVKREDRGQYMCQVNTDPMKMQTAFLEVVIPPDIIYEETSGDMMVPEGGSAKLICKARGFPPPKILWRREDGGDIISRGGPQGKHKVTSLEGDIVNLTKVTRSEMGAYLCIAANGVPPSMRLIIRNIQRSDLGGYKCISKNSIGDAEGNIRLYEMELPNRKAKDEDDYALEETNDVRSSLQGPLREGSPRAEDAGFLGGGAPAPSSSQRVQSAMFLISALAILC
ncbi:Lachesin [Operophtera brumata]|uniref:Lachesin n=1 Tax=Operophtera brumata TaxID=104452 RepID=A0A0L7LS06_OPEBR|nr:Lachesin [Operophtera brumata]